MKIHHNFQPLIGYLQAASQLPPPDLFASRFDKIRQAYRSSYIHWQHHRKERNRRQKNPQTFIDKLIFSEDQYVREGAIRALEAMRYDIRIDSLIETAIRTSSEEASERLQRAWQFICEKRLREQKFVHYYQLAQLYIENSSEAKSHLNENLLWQIFKNERENVEIRYLAAKALLQFLHFDGLEEGVRKFDWTGATICAVVLREAGLPVENDVLYKTQQQFSDSEFLRAIIARNIHYQDPRQLRKLLGDSSEPVRIYAAGNIFHYPQSEEKRELIKLARNILIQTMRHTDVSFRIYAHCMFWKSPNIEPATEYLEIFLDALKDPDAQVRIAILQNFRQFDMTQAALQLQKLIREDPDPRVQTLALTALSFWVSTSPVLKQVTADAKLNPVLRLFALSSSTFWTVKNAKTFTSGRSIRATLDQIAQIPMFMEDPDAYFRSAIFYILALIGYCPLATIREENNLDVQAARLLHAQIDPIPMPLVRMIVATQFPKINEHTDPFQFVEQFLDHSVDRVRRSASVSYVVLADKNSSILYQKFSQSDDPAQREGAALGFYRLVVRKVYSHMDQDKRMKMLQNRAHDKYYIPTLLETAKKQQQWQQYVDWLSYAIELDDAPQYLYERALLYRQARQYEKALLDLDRALAKESANVVYLQEKTRILHATGKQQQAQETIDLAFSSSHHRAHFSDIAKLAGKIENRHLQYRALQSWLLLQPDKAEPYTRLIEICVKLQKYQQAARYLSYCKRIDEPVSEEQLMEISPALRILRKHVDIPPFEGEKHYE